MADAIESGTYDYIIVGGGASGCVTAGRLVGERNARLLMLEQGKTDDHPLMRMPAGFLKFLKGSPYLLEHESIPQPKLDGRTVAILQGNVLGGGSSINGMVYMRGIPEDYDEWDEVTGGAGWSWQDMLAHFKRQEGNQRLNNDAHGIDGPLKVSDPVYLSEMTFVYLKTMQARGVPLTDDFNAGDQFGVGLMQHTTFPRERCSAVRAFLDPIRSNQKLDLKTQAKVAKILVENHRAVGVEYRYMGEVYRARARQEVILTAGAFITPQLLMLAGIGPAAHLREHGIDVLIDAPGVGSNLHDHHEVPLIATTKRNYGYFGEDTGWRMIKNGLNYMITRGGPVSSTGVEACAFINPEDPAAKPTIKLYCVPSIYGDKEVLGFEPTHGVTFTSCLTKPNSRGTVRLRSADPFAMPAVNPNYLDDEEDMRIQMAAVRYAREGLKVHPLAETIDKELMPGSDVISDEDLAAYCKKTVKTNWHPCGTARIGRADDPMAVLTPDCKVKGIDGLRVFDASLMPSVPRANTNAPTMAAADLAVDKLLAEG